MRGLNLVGVIAMCFSLVLGSGGCISDPCDFTFTVLIIVGDSTFYLF